MFFSLSGVEKMTKKHIIAIADVIIKQANEDCYNMVEIESIVEDWIQLLHRANTRFKQNKFEEYIFTRIEGYTR